MGNTINGSNLRVFRNGVLLGGEKECKINFSHEPRDANTKESGRWETNEEGSLSCEISCSGFVANPEAGIIQQLYDALISKNPVVCRFAVAAGSAPSDSYDSYTGSFRLTSFEDAGTREETRTWGTTFVSTGEVSRNPAGGAS